MQVAKETNVVFWERLDGLFRYKEDGERVMRGGEGGMNVLRIFKRSSGGVEQGGGSTHFMRITCSYQEVLNCNIRSWPASVTEDGLTITLWLQDQSIGRNFQRKFELKFLDEMGARNFFEAYTSALPQAAAKGRSFVDMRNGDSAFLEKDSGSSDDSNEDDDETRSVDLFDRHRQEQENKNDKMADSKDIENLTNLFADEENWGHSQSLFNPMSPSFFNKDN